MKFYYCNKFGHFASECKKKQVEHGKQNSNVTDTSKNNEDSLFLTCLTTHEIPNDLWVLDSGYNNHMTGNRSIVANIDESIRTEVKVSTDEMVKVLGK